VIAIIAIWAAILFPVFAQARAKARQTACIGNIRQNWLGLTMYRDDYDGFYPYSVDVNPALPANDCNHWNVNQAIFTWEGPRVGLPFLENECIMFGTAFPVWLPEPEGRRRAIIEPYLKSDRIYYCPNMPDCWLRGNCPSPFVELSTMALSTTLHALADAPATTIPTTILGRSSCKGYRATKRADWLLRT